MTVKISLICATLVESELIELLVDSLLKQTYPNWELIFIDQSYDHKTTKFIAVDSRIKSIHNPIKGLSLNRNIGIKSARGKIILFPDDDCYYTDVNALQYIIDTYKECPDRNSVLIFQRTLFSNDDLKLVPIKKFGKLFGVQLFCFINAISYNIAILNFNQDIIFDEEFGIGAKFGAAEETLYILTCIKYNFKVIPLTKFLVTHPNKSVSLDLVPDRIGKYTKGFGALVGKLGIINLLSLRLILGCLKNFLFSFFGNKLSYIKYKSFISGYIDIRKKSNG